MHLEQLLDLVNTIVTSFVGYDSLIGLLEEFQKCNALLEEIQKCLEDYLESKRMQFPRYVMCAC